MVKINWKPGTMLSPVPPVLVSCGTVEKPNVMTVAWTGIISSDPVMTYVSIRPQRFSHDIIKENQEFVINLPTWKMVTAVDFCGVKSGKDINKFSEMGLTPAPSTAVVAPQIAECPVSIECKVKSITNYGVHDMFIAEVVGVSVDDCYINDKGALDLEKAGIIAYAHGNYYTLGRNLGSFGFSVNKAKVKQMQKMQKVEVEVKKSKVIAPTETQNSQAEKPRRGLFGLRGGRKNFGGQEKPHRDVRRAESGQEKPHRDVRHAEHRNESKNSFQSQTNRHFNYKKSYAEDQEGKNHRREDRASYSDFHDKKSTDRSSRKEYKRFADKESARTASNKTSHHRDAGGKPSKSGFKAKSVSKKRFNKD